MAKRILRHRKPNRLLLTSFALFIVAVGALGACIALANMPGPDYTGAHFDVAYPLKPRQHIVINDGGAEVDFEITKVTKPNSGGCSRDENREVGTAASVGVSISCFTRTDALLRVGNRQYKGVSLAAGRLDMSYPENGAYGLIPYEATITGNAARETPKVVIHKLPRHVIKYGQPVTVKDGEIATLDGDDQTGVRVGFSTCGGVDSPIVSCLHEEAYINGEKPVGSLISYDQKAHFKAAPGNSISVGSEHIRVIDSDNASYVTVVFEKNS